MWNGSTQTYETAAQFSRDAQLYLVTKEIGGGTALAVMSGRMFEEQAGAILFATNTAALRDIPDINRNLVTASIDVAGLDVDDPSAGTFHATVDQVMARAVTALYFHIRNGANYPPKQILTGTMSVQLNGGSVSGEIALEGADFVGGARPVNRLPGHHLELADHSDTNSGIRHARRAYVSHPRVANERFPALDARVSHPMVANGRRPALSVAAWTCGRLRERSSRTASRTGPSWP